MEFTTSKLLNTQDLLGLSQSEVPRDAAEMRKATLKKLAYIHDREAQQRHNKIVFKKT